MNTAHKRTVTAVAPRLLNFVFFQIGWFACVLGAAYGVPLVGPLVVALVLGFHLYTTEDPGIDARLVLTVGLLGALVDTLQGYAGVFHFYNQIVPAWVAPPWIIALWMAFATTLRSSLGWLAQRYWLAASLGAIAGPLAYYAGYKFGALSFPVTLGTSLAVLAIVWAILMPTVMWISILSDAKTFTANHTR